MEAEHGGMDVEENFLSRSLISEPKILSMDEAINETKLQRKTISFESRDKEFLSIYTNLSSQFFSLYQHRLYTISPGLKKKALEKWPGLEVVPHILHATEARCILVGTVIKHMPLKPNVLAEYTKERAILSVPLDKSFWSADDVMFLEDESGRARLLGLNAKDFVAGTVLAVVGHGTDAGDFEVEDFELPGYCPQKPFPRGDNAGKYVLLLSGLSIGSDDVNPLHLKLLIEFLTGNVGSAAEHDLQRNIVRVVIAGNSLSYDAEIGKDISLRFSKKEQSLLTQCVRELDLTLMSLCSSCPVDLMPGEKDPANYSLPQQPLNRCLLPRCAAQASRSLHLATNPHKFTLGGVEFLGTSGQPITNMLQYLDMTHTELTHGSLKWQHMAPTAPDTMSCASSYHDPLVITETPHVYFVGNMPEYYSTLESVGTHGETCRIVHIPSFSQSHTCVLLDLNSLETIPMRLAAFDDGLG